MSVTAKSITRGLTNHATVFGTTTKRVFGASIDEAHLAGIQAYRVACMRLSHYSRCVTDSAAGPSRKSSVSSAWLSRQHTQTSGRFKPAPSFICRAASGQAISEQEGTLDCGQLGDLQLVSEEVHLGA
jgi:hypothetical protein